MTSSTENLEETIGQAANRMAEESLAQDFLFEEDSDYGDPKPPSPQATPEQRNEYILDCEKYASETLDTFIKYTTFSGRVLWEEYTRTFRPETIYAISSNLVIRWTDYLRDGGVRLEYRRGFSRRKALAATLSAEIFPDGSQEPLVEDQQEEQQEEEIVGLSAQELRTTPVQKNAVEKPQPLPANPTPFSFPLEQKKQPVKTRLDVPTQHSLQQNDRDDVVDNRLHDKTERSYSKSRIDTINKAFLNREKYSGAFTENFDGHVEEYETLCRVFELTNDEMARAFPIMLKGAAFTHYSHHYARKKLNYRELVEEFRIWYTSEEQKYRLLQVWQRPSLEKAMANDPDKSQMEVFRHVSDELIKTQLQLHEDYRKDRFLRDQLLIAADIPRLRRSLIERIPSTAQEAMQRIATLLSSEPKSAGAFFTNDADAALYGFGKRFGGQARGKYKKFGKKDSLKRKLALVRGCWVCGKNHPAKGNHSPQEIINDINMIKSSKPARAFTTEVVKLHFIPLQRHSLRLLLFTDASFACTPNLKSRMGFVLVLGDTEGRANILAWGSQVCSRVTRSVMAAELLALVYGFDCAHVVQNSLRETLGFDVPIYAHVDSRTVFNTVAKHNSTLEKRLQIDVHSIRQSYRRGEIYSLSWISGKTNPADGLTKGPISASHPLWCLMITNRYKAEPSGWVRQVPIRPRHAPERDTAPLSDDYEIVIGRENL